MNKLTKRLLLFCFTSLILVVTYPASAERNSPKSTNKAFLMEIAVSGRPSFYMPVKVDDKRVAVVPMPGTTASAVKILPTVKGNSVHFELLAVVEKLPQKLSCDEIKILKTEPVTSFSARAGSVTRVSDFGKFGIGSFLVMVKPLGDFETICPDGACCCGGNTCYPNPGHCIECGSCGTCCRSQ